MIRFSREKLMALRPAPRKDAEWPEALKHMEGSVCISIEAQDPVCWDNFDADEIWAQATTTRERRSSTPKGASTAGGRGLRDLDPETTIERAPPPGRSGSGFRSGGGGRWQRGVALPPADDPRRAGGKAEVETEDPDDLWDDPADGPTSAASDFSMFGGSLDDDRPAVLGSTGMEGGGVRFERYVQSGCHV